VEVTVDHATRPWHGHVGVVTTLIERARIDPQRTLALVCGPEIMMRFAAEALAAAGIAPEAIFLSLERNMHCGLGTCGHCQLGGLLVCRDGPVVRYARVRDALRVREL
jgi:NAD(P)H-flavin reductase